MIFRNWVLQTFPFLEDDFDALTDYELFCKMMEYVKGFAKDNEEFKKQLADFENYFNNLDVQEEINEKLDKMAQDGTLENLIGQYIELMTTYAYNNVAEMKSATNLVNGSFARTSGFYSYNDGGGSFYKIRTVTNEDVVDESNIIALSNNTLVAELVKEKTMSPKQFGAYGDNIHDDTQAIQTCFDNSKNIIFDDGVYLVNAITHLYPKSNSFIDLGKATLKCITNNNGQYALLQIENVENLIITNGTIQGDRDTHTGTTGEWGHCIRINSGNNILIKNIILKNAWGDGLYIFGGSNIKTHNVVCDNNRRQGISIISVNGYHSLNDEIKNTNGTAPESGLDIEPNLETDIINGIIIDNLYSHDNNGDGIDISLIQLGSNGNANITINNPLIENCNKGIYGGYAEGVKGRIIINNLTIKNVNSSGIDLSSRYSNNGLELIINNPRIENFNLNNSSNISAMSFGSGDSEWGNIIIKNPYISTTDEVIANSRGVNIGGNTTHHPINVILDTPLNNQLPIYNSYGENIKIIDPLELYKSSTYTNEYLQNNTNINSVYSNENAINNLHLYLRNYTSIGLDTKIIKLADYDFIVSLPSGHYCRTLTNGATNRPNIKLTNIGDSITLRRISSNEWIVVNMVGTPTITT